MEVLLYFGSIANTVGVIALSEVTYFVWGTVILISRRNKDKCFNQKSEHA